VDFHHPDAVGLSWSEHVSADWYSQRSGPGGHDERVIRNAVAIVATVALVSLLAGCRAQADEYT